MSKLEWVAAFAAPNVLLLLLLSLVVVRGRWAVKVAMGDGGDQKLAQAIRAHANHAEHAPLALVGLTLLALLDAVPLAAVLGLGGALTVGRFAHAYGLLTNPARSPGRTVGVLLTWATLAGIAGFLMYGALATQGGVAPAASTVQM